MVKAPTSADANSNRIKQVDFDGRAHEHPAPGRVVDHGRADAAIDAIVGEIFESLGGGYRRR